ncbi:(2Fe-2S)-binding protein [Streptomyces triculaminicus]|uniref:(2Fe-2S)-binding protein n=1 Tax=Streptomyces triculaminicus TaxID=2816232 RepID=UPI0037CDD5D8
MLLRELAAVGPFFGLRVGDAPDDVPDAAEGYLPLGAEAMRLRVATVAERLGTADRRVAASIAFQGIAGRLLSIGLGSAVLTGRVPDLTAGPGLRWHPVRGAPDDLWLPAADDAPPAATAEADEPEPQAAPLAAGVLHGLLVPLHRATRAATPVSARLLWGNAGSSLAGSLRVLHTWCHERGRPQDAARALALTRALFEDPLLRDTGTLTAGPGGVSFARGTCCLYYRVPGGGLCGDCVLRHPPRSR